jgi:pimeloyl-ACP methyl ester carboxylesterase
VRERVVTFGPDRGLVGVLCEPGAPPEEATPLVLIPNSGIVHHVGIWRLHTRAARRLAAAGFPSLRFDLSGIGDSEPPAEALSIGDVVIRDLTAAADYVRSQGKGRIVVMGLCSGGRDALELAALDPAVVGTVAIDLMSDFRTLRHRLVHFGPRLLRWSSWKKVFLGRNPRLSRAVRSLSGVEDATSSEPQWPQSGPRSKLSRARLEEMLSGLLERDVRMLFVFSNGLEGNYNHAGQFAGALPRIAADHRVSEQFFEQADHTFSDPGQQALLLDACVSWVESCFGGA